MEEGVNAGAFAFFHNRLHSPKNPPPPCPTHHCKNQIVVKNLRIVARWWTLSEGHLLRLSFGVFQPSVVSSSPSSSFSSFTLLSVLIICRRCLRCAFPHGQWSSPHGHPVPGWPHGQSSFHHQCTCKPFIGAQFKGKIVFFFSENTKPQEFCWNVLPQKKSALHQLAFSRSLIVN